MRTEIRRRKAFKREVVREVKASGATIASVQRNYEVHRDGARWVRRARAVTGPEQVWVADLTRLPESFRH